MDSSIAILGMRDDAKKLVILLTDGVQNPKRYDPIAASKVLYDKGATILAVGITKDVDEKQLEAITRKKENVFFAESFDQLDSSTFVDAITGKMCVPAEPEGTVFKLFISDNSP